MSMSSCVSQHECFGNCEFPCLSMEDELDMGKHVKVIE